MNILKMKSKQITANKCSRFIKRYFVTFVYIFPYVILAWVYIYRKSDIVPFNTMQIKSNNISTLDQGNQPNLNILNNLNLQSNLSNLNLQSNLKNLNLQSYTIDTTRKNYTPWPEDSQCKKFLTHFGMNLRPVYLRSFPRSGNSWARYLLEGASGIFTSSIYRDPTVIKFGFLGETEKQNKNTTLVIKTHRLTFPEIPTILLLRHPEKVITSLYAFKHSKGQNVYKGTVQPELYNSEGFHNHATAMINNWKKFASGGINNSEQLLVVQYKDLQIDPLGEIKKMLNFLGVPLDQARMDCVQQHITGKAQRKSKEIDPYTEEEKQLMELAVSEINVLLKNRGIKEMPTINLYK